MRHGLSACVAAALAAGCASLQPPPPVPQPSPRLLIAEAPSRGQSGGVFSPAARWSLMSDNRAFRPGDVLTVVLQETTQASKSADTSIAKDSSIGIGAPTIAGRALKTDISVEAGREFSGTSSSSQENSLRGAITVIVHEVLPNGLLRIEGEKSVFINQGEELIHLSGYVRADDIGSDNRISSQRVANARIAYSGRGALADANSAGWLTRFFVSPWMPF